MTIRLGDPQMAKLLRALSLDHSELRLSVLTRVDGNIACSIDLEQSVHFIHGTKYITRLQEH